MGCATSMVKFFLFFFNFLFVVGGIGLVALGALTYNGIETYEVFYQPGMYKASPIGMMVVGSIILLIAFMGCCGVLRESKCMMVTYATFLLILLVLQVLIAVGIFKFQDEFKGELEKGMKATLNEYGNSERPEVTETWDSIQQNLKCCGVTDYKDWTSAGVDIPESCCRTPGTGCVPNNLLTILAVTADLSIYTEGCLEKAVNDVKTEYAMYVAAIVAGIELLGVILGCCLGARFGNKRYNV